MNFLQAKAVNIATKGHNLLLLGRAGTGKSYVVNTIANELRNIGKKVQITCSTGIACSVYPPGDACTIHHFLGLSDCRYGPEEIVKVIKNNRCFEYVVENVNNIDTIILDECSMISKRVFDTINRVCQIKDTSKTFGGIQIIFCGDFYQLPPVCNARYHDNGEYCFQSNDFKETFPHTVTLKENIRQCQHQLINTLEEVFTGKLSAESEDFICSLNRKLETPTPSVKLFSKHDSVDAYNRQRLLDFPGSGRLYEFKSSGKLSFYVHKKMNVH